MNYTDLLNAYKQIARNLVSRWSISSDHTIIPKYSTEADIPNIDERDEANRNITDACFLKLAYTLGLDFSDITNKVASSITNYPTMKDGEDSELYNARKDNFIGQLRVECTKVQVNKIKEVVRREINNIEKNIDLRIKELNSKKKSYVESGLLISSSSLIADIDKELADLEHLQARITEDKDLFFIQAPPYSTFKFEFMTIPNVGYDELAKYYNNKELMDNNFMSEYVTNAQECSRSISIAQDRIKACNKMLEEPKKNIALGINVSENQKLVDALEAEINRLNERIKELGVQRDFYKLCHKMSIASKKESRDTDLSHIHHEADKSRDKTLAELAKTENSILAFLFMNESRLSPEIKADLDKYKELNELSKTKGFDKEFELEMLKKKLIGFASKYVDSSLVRKYEELLGSLEDRNAELASAKESRDMNVPNHNRMITIYFEGAEIKGYSNPAKIRVGESLVVPKLSDIMPEKPGYDFIGWTYDLGSDLDRPFEFQLRKREVSRSMLKPEDRERLDQLELKEKLGYLTLEEGRELDKLRYSEYYESPALFYNLTLKANFRKKALDKDVVDLDIPVIDLTEKCTVSFDTNGGHNEGYDYPDIIVDKGFTISDSIPDPILDDEHEFEGWYLDGKPFSFDTPVDNDMTLTAKYKELTKDDPVEIVDEPKFTDDTIKITFVGENGEVIFEREIKKGSKYPGLTPDYDANNKRIKGYKQKEDGTWKKKKSTRLRGWLDPESSEDELVNFSDRVFTKDTILKAKCTFDWERVASVGVGAITTALVLNSPLVLASGALASGVILANNVAAGFGAFILKNLVDQGIINKREPITGIKPSDKIKAAMTKLYNTSIANAYNHDNVIHASLAGAIISGIDHYRDLTARDVNDWNDFEYDESYTETPGETKLDLSKIQAGDTVYDDEAYIHEGVIGRKEYWSGELKAYVDTVKGGGTASDYVPFDMDADALTQLGPDHKDLVVFKIVDGKEIAMGRFKFEDVQKYLVNTVGTKVKDVSATISNMIEAAKAANPTASAEVIAQKVSEKAGQVVTADKVQEVIGSSLSI